MPKFVKKLMCGLLNHKYHSADTKRSYDEDTQPCTVTETCCRCGKKASYAFQYDI